MKYKIIELNQHKRDQELEGIEGKKIKKMYYSYNEMHFLLDDNSIIALTSDGDWEGDTSIVGIKEINDWTLHKLGLMTLEQFHANVEEKKKREQEKKEKDEREMYEYLKQKFEGKK